MRKAFVVLAVMIFVETASASDHDLRGAIFDSSQAPIPNATVYVYSAGVKVGTSPYCPTCYPDCGKLSKTDADGRFRIDDLNPELRFKLLAVAEGYLPQFIENADPGHTEIAGTLAVIPEHRMAPEFGVRGRVMDPEGRPVIGATIEFEHIHGSQFRPPPETLRKLREGESRKEYSKEMRALFQELAPDREKIDRLAVTNEDGVFALTSEYPNARYDITVRARGLAPKYYSDYTSRSDATELNLKYGVTAWGMVDAEESVLDTVVIGMAQDQSSGHFFGEFTIGVDDNGYFEIPNLPATFTYVAYGKMQSLQESGILETRTVRVGTTGERADFGRFTVKPGLRVHGRVILSDGKPLPPKTRLYVGRRDAWDALLIELGEDGSFEARHIPSGGYSITLRMPGYYMSEKNHSLDALNPGSLRGVITEDYENLDIYMEAGTRDRDSAYSQEIADKFTRQGSEPIRGYTRDN